jgi:hypothetical protein
MAAIEGYTMIGNGGGAVHCMCQALKRDLERNP